MTTDETVAGFVGAATVTITATTSLGAVRARHGDWGAPPNRSPQWIYGEESIANTR